MKNLLYLLVILPSYSLASPFYFYTGMAPGAGEVGIGAEVWANEKFGLDIEAGYTRTGWSSSREITLAYNDIPAETPEPPPPAVSEPIVIIDVVVPVKPPPPPEPVEPSEEPREVVRPLPCYEEVCPSAASQTASGPPTVTPKMKNDIFSIKGAARIKVTDFIWLNLNFGAEKKSTDGKLEKKGIDDQSFMYFRNTERFQNDSLDVVVGASALFQFRKQLKGYLKADYHDFAGTVDGFEAEQDNLVVTAGLRFRL